MYFHTEYSADLNTGLPPRLTAGLPGIEAKVSHAALNGRGYSTQHSTPFGSNRGGPSVEIFKSRFADGNARSGFTPSGKRSMSGSLLPAFQQPQRANSVGFCASARALLLIDTCFRGGIGMGTSHRLFSALHAVVVCLGL